MAVSRFSRFISFLAASFTSSLAPAHDLPTTLDRLVVVGREADLLGHATSASDGEVGAADLATRPILRRGELLEVVPGVVITQHSGAGKANQYFLRGFNLDHGTDFAVSVDGLPVNLRSHAHGQGYSDLNFIIPELIAGVTYQKGQHTAANGDFSAAGAAQFRLVRSLPHNFVRLEGGENRSTRLVAGGTKWSGRSAATTLGFEASHDDGPWTEPERHRRFNVFARHARSTPDSDTIFTVLGYRGEWNATDQIPLRAVDAGLIDRWGTLDPTDGGTSDRASLSFDWIKRGLNADTRLNLHLVSYRLDLYSNFTYFLSDPATGDQFNQRDRRVILGGELVHTRETTLAGRPLEIATGLQVRSDLIDVGLHTTAARVRLATVREDEIAETSAGAFAQGTWFFSEFARITAGLRADGHVFDVDSDEPLNSGRRSAGIVSPKLALAFGPWRETEFYAAAGLGFHSNDARGVVIRVDPADGVTPADRADPLVRAKSAEVGLRTSALPGLVSTVSLWALELDSELVYVGDAGATEAGDRTRRIGIEFANHYRVARWLTLDGDVAFTRSRYRDAPGADRIANSIGTVVTGGASFRHASGLHAHLRLRYFGSQPLIEDNSVRAPSSLTLNLRLGWRREHWECSIDTLNLLDRRNNDIAYHYTSRLPGEPLAGRDDIHFHPAEPRTLRVSLTRTF